MTPTGTGPGRSRRRRRLAALAVVGLGTIVVAAVSLALAGVDRSPRPSPTTTAASSAEPSRGPALAPPPTSRTHLDATLAEGTADPLGSTIDSPTWFADGGWWGALLDPPTGQTRLYRLAADGTAWQDTGRILDERVGAIADAVWADGHLYLATVVRDRSVDSAVRLTRYTPDAASGFRPDPDFPVRLTDRGVRSMSLARDGSGRLWLAIVRDGAVQVAHSTANDVVWTAPAPLASGATVADDDVAALVAFGPGRLGIAWTARAASSVGFAARADGDPPESWSAAETVTSGRPLLDDPISVAAVADGSVLVSVAGDVRVSATSPTAARLVVARRTAAGEWAAAVVGRAEDRHASSAVLVGGGATPEIDIVATQQSAGSQWVLKRSGLGRLEFEAGIGEPVAAAAGVAQPDLGGPHLAKEGAGPGAAILVVGYDSTLHRYVHSLFTPAPDGSATPPPSASPGSASGSPPAGPIKALPLVPIDDTFDLFAVGTQAPNGWLPRDGDPAANVAIAAAAGHGNVLALRSAASDNVRACKSFGSVSAGIVTVTALVRLGALGTADATITSVRLHGTEAALVRFASGGTFAYYAGATKVRTAVPWSVGTWYRSTVRIDLGRKTYDWQLAREGASASLVNVRGIAFRDPAATAVDSVCVQTSSGRAGLGLDIDRITVTR